MTNAHTDQKQVLFIPGGGEGGYEADATITGMMKKLLYPISPSMPKNFLRQASTR